MPHSGKMAESVTPLISLLYVSCSTISPRARAQELQRIVNVAQAHNATMSVTGALVATTTHFAQILEGPQEAVAELMRRIRRDVRHKDIVVLSQTAIGGRRFPGWSLAYSGPATYMARKIKPIFDVLPSDDRNILISNLYEIMVRFSGCVDMAE